MRIILITQGFSPIVTCLFESNYKLVGIVEDGPRVPVSRNTKRKDKIISFMCSTFIKNKVSLFNFCKHYNIPFFYIDGKQDEALEFWIREKNPDLIVVYSMSHLLKKSVFSIPTYGTINLHPSLLPEYRGPNPIFWMYYNMEKFGGVTIHFIDEGEDTGDIILQEKVPLKFGAPIDDFRFQLIDVIGVKLLLTAVNLIDCGKVLRITQSKESPTIRARNLLPGEEKSIIEWEVRDVKWIWHMVNGYAGIYDFIEQIDPPPFGCKGVYHSFVECPVNSDVRGTVEKNYGKIRQIYCKNGKILYSYHLRLYKKIKKIIGHLR